MHKLNPHKVGLSVGSFNALVHLVWVLLMGTGMAMGKMKFFLGMHFLSMPFSALKFSWAGGLILVIFAFIGAYVLGYIFSLIWNKVGA